ncbi:phosphate signaling complex protein PhoU [Methyloversatilis sp.]|jgi:phosphate transport system protein|uniref:phosphate signaling complex protein PhoU n=1 Tax=Methyloversatilis sp. TaxID=2569862 RepID=UPI001A638A52|nr:phosphate signaling complex protein PhoU [Methyloversatilis sp.]MBL8474971.1 phosphate signaling complex protein PhoU [Methyloversatilis sp.]
MSEHISKRYDHELEGLRTGLLQMGGLIEQQIEHAMRGVIERNLPLLEEVIATEKKVNAMEIELDEACNQLIAKRQPAASDLRVIMSMVKTITDLERVGDEAKKIAKMGRHILESDAIFVPRVELRHAASMAVDMLRRTLDALARQDLASATEVVRQDKEVDAEFKSIMRQLITFMMEDPRTISCGLDMLFIAKAIERIGDHSKNMAQYVVFMVKGTDVRHAGLAAMEAAAAAD